MRNREWAKEKAHELVSQMTLEEKASQLRYDAPAIPRLESLPITGGMRLFTGWREPVWQPASLRQSPWRQPLTTNC